LETTSSGPSSPISVLPAARALPFALVRATLTEPLELTGFPAIVPVTLLSPDLTAMLRLISMSLLLIEFRALAAFLAAAAALLPAAETAVPALALAAPALLTEVLKLLTLVALSAGYAATDSIIELIAALSSEAECVADARSLLKSPSEPS